MAINDAKTCFFLQYHPTVRYYFLNVREAESLFMQGGKSAELCVVGKYCTFTNSLCIFEEKERKKEVIIMKESN